MPGLNKSSPELFIEQFLGYLTHSLDGLEFEAHLTKDFLLHRTGSRSDTRFLSIDLEDLCESDFERLSEAVASFFSSYRELIIADYSIGWDPQTILFWLTPHFWNDPLKHCLSWEYA